MQKRVAISSGKLRLMAAGGVRIVKMLHTSTPAERVRFGPTLAAKRPPSRLVMV